MSVPSVVYSGYVHTLKSEPGYTGQVNHATRNEPELGSVPQRSELNAPKDTISKSSTKSDHLRTQADITAMGNFQYRTYNRTDWARDVFVNQKLWEGQRKGRLDIDTEKRSEEIQSSDYDRSLAGVKGNHFVDSSFQDREFFAGGTMAMDRQSGLFNNSRNYYADDEVMWQETVPVPRDGPNVRFTDQIGAPSWIDTGQGVNYRVDPTAADYVYSVGNTLEPGRVDPELVNAEFGIYQDVAEDNRRDRLAEAYSDIRAEKYDGIFHYNFEHGITGDWVRNIGGVWLKMPFIGNVRFEPEPIARVGLFVDRLDFDGGWAKPKINVNGYNPFSPIPDREVKTDEEQLGRKQFVTIERNPVPDYASRRFFTQEHAAVPMMLEAKDMVLLNMADEPIGVMDSHVIAKQTLPKMVDVQAFLLEHPVQPMLMDRNLGVNVREPFLDLVEDNYDPVRIGPEANVSVPEIPPTPEYGRVTGDHPFDYQSGFQPYVYAHRVQDEAQDFRRMEHKEEQTREIEKPNHEKLKKITQRDFIDRADPRIQEVIMLQQRIDHFGTIKAVMFEGKAAEGLPTYNDNGQAVQYTTKGALIDTLAVDWSGPQQGR